MLIGTAPLVPLVSIGMLLTMAGIYGVLAFAIARRSRELAVRVAIDANPRNLAWLVAKQTLALIAAGGGIGLLLTFALSRNVRASRSRDRAHSPNDASARLLSSCFLNGSMSVRFASGPAGPTDPRISPGWTVAAPWRI